MYCENTFRHEVSRGWRIAQVKFDIPGWAVLTIGATGLRGPGNEAPLNIVGE